MKVIGMECSNQTRFFSSAAGCARAGALRGHGQVVHAVEAPVLNRGRHGSKLELEPG